MEASCRKRVVNRSRFSSLILRVMFCFCYLISNTWKVFYHSLIYRACVIDLWVNRLKCFKPCFETSKRNRRFCIAYSWLPTWLVKNLMGMDLSVAHSQAQAQTELVCFTGLSVLESLAVMWPLTIGACVSTSTCVSNEVLFEIRGRACCEAQLYLL